jgi:hypothetical protein
MAIYVNFEKPETLKEFLSKLFSCYYLNVFTTQATYFDKEKTQIQCRSKKWRSFDDLLEIVNTYFPEVTPKELIHELLVCQPNGRTNYIPSLRICSTIMRIRIYYHIEDNLNLYNPFGSSKLNSKYSWAELLNMLGITTYEEYKDYVNKNREVVKLEEVNIF